MLVDSPLVSDFIVAVIVAVPILIAIKVTERFGSDYCWVNRKIFISALFQLFMLISLFSMRCMCG